MVPAWAINTRATSRLRGISVREADIDNEGDTDGEIDGDVVMDRDVDTEYEEMPRESRGDPPETVNVMGGLPTIPHSSLKQPVRPSI